MKHEILVTLESSHEEEGEYLANHISKLIDRIRWSTDGNEDLNNPTILVDGRQVYRARYAGDEKAGDYTVSKIKVDRTFVNPEYNKYEEPL